MTAAGPPPVGALAAEAAQLLDAVTVRVQQFRAAIQPVDDPAPAGVDGQAPASSTHTCVGWCPVCRAAELLNGDRPETAAKLADAVLLLLGTVRSLLPHDGAEGTASAGDGTAATGPDQEPPAPRVERIDIR